jgi:hypothetical protein
MVYVVKKEGKTYIVRHRYTKVTKGTRNSHSEATRFANELNRSWSKQSVEQTVTR